MLRSQKTVGVRSRHCASILQLSGGNSGRSTTRLFCYISTAQSPCHLAPSSHIRPLATAAAASLHQALSLASRLMLLVLAPFAYPLSVSSHLCRGLPLFLAPFFLPSITSSSILLLSPRVQSSVMQPLSPLTPVSIPV